MGMTVSRYLAFIELSLAVHGLLKLFTKGVQTATRADLRRRSLSTVPQLPSTTAVAFLY